MSKSTTAVRHAAALTSEEAARRDTFLVSMRAAIADAAAITRLAEAGLESAAHDWTGEEWLRHICAEGIGTQGARLLTASALGQLMSRDA